MRTVRSGSIAGASPSDSSRARRRRRGTNASPPRSAVSLSPAPIASAIAPGSALREDSSSSRSTRTRRPGCSLRAERTSPATAAAAGSARSPSTTAAACRVAMARTAGAVSSPSPTSARWALIRASAASVAARARTAGLVVSIPARASKTSGATAPSGSPPSAAAAQPSVRRSSPRRLPGAPAGSSRVASEATLASGRPPASARVNVSSEPSPRDAITTRAELPTAALTETPRQAKGRRTGRSLPWVVARRWRAASSKAGCSENEPAAASWASARETSP